VIRLFDVDVDRKTGNPVPVGPLRISPAGSKFLAGFKPGEILALVFITNRSLLNLRKNDIAGFAGRVLSKMREILDPAGIHIGQLQVDCDWTVSTRDTCFALLENPFAAESLFLVELARQGLDDSTYGKFFRTGKISIEVKKSWENLRSNFLQTVFFKSTIAECAYFRQFSSQTFEQ